MNNTRLGCLTPVGLIAGGLTLLIVLGITLLLGGVVFSPGGLNSISGSPLGGYSSHAEFSGECKLCHAPFWDSAGMSSRCSSCHSAIPAQQSDPATLHGALFVGDPTLECRQCHPEHRGPDGILVDFHGEGFPHFVLGFSLIGHARTSKAVPFNCADCHDRDVTTFHIGVCQECHTEDNPDFTNEHILTFGSDCLDCHDGIDTFGNDFDHDLFPFPLEGKHGGLACLSCHLNARSITDLRSAPLDCFSCHASDDTHSGELGIDCSSCHSPEGWSPANFDHTLANFQLDGKHAEVTCESCHIDNRFKNTPLDCNSCHSADDIHQGILGINCQDCHTPASWTMVNYDHNLSAFKLTGQHINTACVACHTTKAFKGTPTECFSCHSGDDVHQGSLGMGCSTCHTTLGWKPSTFNHNLAKFTLTGQHLNTTCAACHKNLAFKGTPSACFDCHSADDAHQGSLGTSCSTCHSTFGWKPATFNHNLAKFVLTGQHLNTTCAACHNNMVFKGTPSACFDCHSTVDAHQGSLGTSCSTCHSTFGWKPATFDHNLAAFKLTGKHSSIPCASCHINNVFKGTPSSCYACHAGDDAHLGKYGSNCSSCHSTSGWKPASFDHNLSGFPLTGAHVNLPCTSCHIGGTFTGLNSSCAACHGEPAFHAGFFSSMACSQCHSTNAWKPASFNLSHSENCDGPCINHQGATCQDCHTPTLATYTCLKCHDSNDPKD